MQSKIHTEILVLLVQNGDKVNWGGWYLLSLFSEHPSPSQLPTFPHADCVVKRLNSLITVVVTLLPGIVGRW